MLKGIRIQGDALTKSIREEGLFSQFEDFKCDKYWLIVYDESDMQSLLGYLSLLMMLHETNQDKNYFGATLNNIKTMGITTDEFLDTFKKNYGDNISELTIVILGNIECEKYLDNVIKTSSRSINSVVNKSIPETIFEKFIINSIEENENIQDYKSVSDLALTLLDAKDKILSIENKVDVILLIDKLKSMLHLYTINMIYNRQRVKDLINDELTKFMILLGAPY